MKDENQHFKITSVQCTYYKPGHLLYACISCF